MAMIVQHNMSAMNANRMLGVTSSSLSKSTEKLSSGYRINRAADDAAGLSISEKMRSQIRGENFQYRHQTVQRQMMTVRQYRRKSVSFRKNLQEFQAQQNSIQ